MSDVGLVAVVLLTLILSLMGLWFVIPAFRLQREMRAAIKGLSDYKQPKPKIACLLLGHRDENLFITRSDDFHVGLHNPYHPVPRLLVRGQFQATSQCSRCGRVDTITLAEP